MAQRKIGFNNGCFHNNEKRQSSYQSIMTESTGIFFDNGKRVL